MKSLISCILAGISIVLMPSCSKNTTPAPEQLIHHALIDQTLKTYTPQVGTQRFEYTFWMDYSEAPFTLDCSLGFLMSWEKDPDGYYAHFNNSIGAILTNAKGQAMAFDKGVLISDKIAGQWNADGALSYDYVLNPGLDKGGLAGKGDKYIVIKTWDGEKGRDTYYYGWIKVNVSADGRVIKVLEQGVQSAAGEAIKTGAY